MAKSSFKPLPLKEQTIVITDGASGFGLLTARVAAREGAQIVIASRNGDELQRCADEMSAAGGKVLAVIADVSRKEDLLRLKDEAIKAFGKIDTWINNAGNSLHAQLMESSIEKERKVFEVNFWGARMGSQIAVEAMARRGGTLINFGHETSSSSEPLLGIYSASKYAVKSFTDALRVEIKTKGVPVAVCLIRPVAFDSQLDVVAEAILKCSVSPQRDVYVGGPARLSAILDTFFPKVKDIVSESQMQDLSKDKTKDLTTLNVVRSLIRQGRNHEKTNP